MTQVCTNCVLKIKPTHLLSIGNRWVPCHHGMARPQVADGGDSLQFWRLAENILNKQSRTADKGVAFQLGGWAWGTQILTVKNKLVTKDHKKPRTWTDSLDNRPKRKKMDMRFGTWNVRNMYSIR
jgi:hypothetical protein